MSKAAFGKTPDGAAVDVYTLTNANGVEVRAITFGGIITSIRVPDRTGKFDDVALGFGELEPYLRNPPYFGAIIGRYANRIAKGRFVLDGRTYTLAVNNRPNHLHGGIKGFDKVVWKAEPFELANGAGLVFTHVSPDDDEGYPGTLTVKVTYTLNNDNELAFEYEASTDRGTPVNLTQHTYFNLAGEGNGDILGHVLTVHASRMTPVGPDLIPTGIASVAGTPFDFRAPTAIGARIRAGDPQIRNGNGYDHNFVLDRTRQGLELAARVEEPTSGRVLEVSTTEPGMQFYTGNFLDGSLTGKSGRPYAQRTGFALETQHYPDSPNHPEFPTTVLRPGEVYRSKTVYAFKVAR
ncbi:MAG TPA: aldose epimerase family protein [Vicinamibacterales bacterium]|nr:aldose epimerase family protein [Vicinamibacterales bacterium]